MMASNGSSLKNATLEGSSFKTLLPGCFHMCGPRSFKTQKSQVELKFPSVSQLLFDYQKVTKSYEWLESLQ